MNSHILKVVGEAEMPEALELGKDYLISINAGISKISKKSDEEGGFVFSYSAKQRTCEVLKDNGEILKTKDKTHQSVQTRRAIEATRSDFGPEMDEEDWYILIQ